MDEAPSIVVCHPEITGLFVRWGATRLLLAADTASLAVDGVPALIDLDAACTRAAIERANLDPGIVLRLEALPEGTGPGPLPGVETGRRERTFAPASLDEIIASIGAIGRWANAETAARIETARITHAIAKIAVRRDGRSRLSVAWVTHTDPLTVVGASGLLHELLELAGAENAFHERAGPRFEVTLDEIEARTPDLILVPDDGRHELRLAVSPTRRFPTALARVPTLEPVGRVAELSALLYPGED